jgi:protease-4
MALDPDVLFDRRRLKRQLVFWRVLGAVALVALALSLVWRFNQGGLPLGEHVAELDVSGIIVDDRDRLDAVMAAAEDDRVRALVVIIDSPGGTYIGGETLYLALRKVAAEKPVVAVMRGVAASGGYMTALGADRIFARDGTITGSIGVIMQTADVTGLLDKLGIRPESFKSSALKATPNPLETVTPEVRRATQDVVNNMYGAFLEMFIDRRGIDPAAAGRLADGRIFTGRQALAAGMIDEIGGIEEARAWLESAHQVPADMPSADITPEEDDSVVEKMISAAIGDNGAPAALRLDGLLSVWHPHFR